MPVLAVDGVLDNSFDTDGIVTTNIGTTDFGYSVAIQADGKILVAGSSRVGGTNDFTIVRYNANGSLDTSFDTDGIATTNIGYDDAGRSVAIQADGKILVAGRSGNAGAYDFAIVRYNANGSLDTSFDTDGIATTNIGAYDEGRSVAIQPDGKILVAGYSGGGGAYDFAIVRYNANGSLDTSFDTDGIISTDIDAEDDGYSVAIQPDGKILVAGYSGTGSALDFVVIRYNANGSLDTSFDTDGIATTNIGTEDLGRSLAIQPDGKILVAGSSGAGSAYDFAIVRYNANGSLDTSFDTDGIITTDIGTYDDGYSVAIQPDGKILVAGYNSTGGAYDFSIVRYNANGSLDTSFDTDGIATTNIHPDEGGYSVAIQPDGKILVAGNTNSGSGYDFAIVRYQASPLTATLAASTTTSTSTSITYTVTGTGNIDCSTLSTTAGVDFNLAGISAITSITQTSPTVCTIAANSSAIAGGAAVTSTLTAASSFSVNFMNGNSRTTMSGSPQSVTVAVPAPAAPTTTATIPKTAKATTTAKKVDVLPKTGSNSSAVALIGLFLAVAGLALTSRRRSVR